MRPMAPRCCMPCKLGYIATTSGCVCLLLSRLLGRNNKGLLDLWKVHFRVARCGMMSARMNRPLLSVVLVDCACGHFSV